MRRIYRFMDVGEKKKAIDLAIKDIDQLKKEYENDYPAIVKDAIEETIHKYKKDVEFLKEDLKKIENSNL
ncbi:hypothetical protein [Sporolactobacillus terrae]|uniref:Uncharacterized protein n=1 Tax=Sporolactobacillus terrae TaxID=269673 RepID=A0A5K7WTA6_9BACL|nr:hypothetical protein [Sporolactobacillus terrae]BBN97725.1 hypothetical protein St703_04300 [Sporolactobacillus terrae]